MRYAAAAMLYSRRGDLITSINEWTRPKSVKQWEPGRSAMELARAWTRVAGACAAPSEFEALLRAHSAFTDVEIVSGTPEALIAFDQFGGPRNADLNLICTSKRGPVVISVEAKADETYGGTVAQALQAAQQRLARGVPTNAHTRIKALTRRFTPDLHNHAALPYQLFTATAATLTLAERLHAVAALLIVHEFINGTRRDGRRATTDSKVRRNAVAFDAFVRAISRGAIDHVLPPAIVGPLPVDGRIPFYIGKLQTDLNSRSSVK